MKLEFFKLENIKFFDEGIIRFWDEAENIFLFVKCIHSHVL